MAIGLLAIAAWALSGYYVMRNSQGFFQGGFESQANAYAYGEAMLDLTGATLATTSNTMKAIAFVLDSFNTFMDTWFGTEDFKSEYGEISTDGMLHIPDLNLYFPNGLVVKVVSGERLETFRFDLTSSSWRGFHVEIKNGMDSSWMTMGVYLTADPNFEFLLSGSDQLNFVDPADGLIKRGDLCTPRQGISDDDVAYVTTVALYMDVIVKALKASGASKTIENFAKFVFSKRLSIQIRNKLEDIFDSVDVILDTIGVVQQEVDLSDDMNKDFLAEKPAFVKKLQRFQYRPYG